MGTLILLRHGRSSANGAHVLAGDAGARLGSRFDDASAFGVWHGQAP